MNRAPDQIRRKFGDDIAKVYALLGVAPIPRLESHDGTSLIEVPEDMAPAAQFTYLWDYLVPLGGGAQTLQGEIIRIAGRLGHEVLDNGYLNWDEDFIAMAAFWLDTVDAVHDAVAKIVGKRGLEKEIDEITRASVEWVKMHAEPIPLGEALPEVRYGR